MTNPEDQAAGSAGRSALHQIAALAPSKPDGDAIYAEMLKAGIPEDAEAKEAFQRGQFEAAEIARAALAAPSPDLVKVISDILDVWSGYATPEMDAAITAMQALGLDRWSMQSSMEKSDINSNVAAPSPVAAERLTVAQRDEVARIIYNAFPYDGPIGKQKPAWIDGGNSFQQDNARQAADTILTALSRSVEAGAPGPCKRCGGSGWLETIKCPNCIDGAPHPQMPCGSDETPLTSGSPMARRQITIGDLRKLAAALTDAERKG